MISLIGNVDYALSRLKGSTGSSIQTTGQQSANFRYATPTFAYTPTKYSNKNVVTAQSQVTYTQPQFYSPLHTPQNWQIPSKRREVMQWLRYFMENEPKVGAAIDFYANFPMNGFETQCDNAKIKRFFDNLNKKLNLDHWCKMISREYYLIGDVFPFLEITCDKCNGTNIHHGKRCTHPGGTFNRIVVLNPDHIDVQQNQFVDEPVITMMPDDELKKVVWQKRPKPIFDRLPPHIRQLIAAGKPIPLDNANVSHLKHDPYPYGVYGTSIIRRLFKVLTYKDKLMMAQWIVAERLILPVRIVKVGNDERPAGASDLADVQQQLAQTAQDPNLTLITHHAIEYDWHGASGKVLTLSNEFEMINKEMLQGLMLNDALLDGTMAGYQCHDMQTRTLTKNGFKHYEEITDADEIGCFNQETGALEYHKPTARHCADFNGELVHFQTNKIDIAVTDNHRMLLQPRGSNEWVVLPAGEVSRRCKFQKTVKWEGNQNYPKFVKLADTEIPTDDYLELVAFYVTEGYCRKETRKARSTYGEVASACIYQTEEGKAWNSILSLKQRGHIKLAHYESGHGDQFVINNKKIAIHLESECGNGSADKKIPKWIKDLPKQLLEKFLADMIDGDGCRRIVPGRHHYYYQYYTKSHHLMNDVMEIALKCGYHPTSRTRRGIWEVYFSEKDLQTDTLTLHSNKCDSITRMPYNGRVYCFTVPTGFFITERNGKIAIQGNSAAIGAEALIQRIDSWRLELGRWIEDHIYKPVAQMRGFIDEEASKELGEPVWIYPKIKWNDLNIRDDSQQKQLWLQLHERQLVSGETVCEKFDLDYDQEIERIRFETANQQIGAGGAGGGGMGAAPPGGGGGGGMGDLFGGGGGAGGAAAPPGGEMPGGGGMGVGGDMGAPGGAPGGAGAPPGGMPSAMGGTMGKILPAGRASKNLKAPKEEVVQPSGVKLTSLEQVMWKMLLAFKQQGLPFTTWTQYPLGKYRADFALPQIRLAIECDGEAWHSHPDKKAQDQMRDAELAKYGWTTVRFAERDLKEAQDAVRQSLLGLIHKLWKKAAEAQEKQQKSMDKMQQAAGATGGPVVGIIVEAGVENRPPMLIEAPPSEQKP